jgi:ATP/maltotriose-dependent transcriptional regulator MalT
MHSGQLSSGEAVSTAIINDLRKLAGRFLLVLDDFQVIQDRFILQVLEKAVIRLSHNSTWSCSPARIFPCRWPGWRCTAKRL